VAAGDYNGDGAGDLSFANGQVMKTWINNGNGVFAESQRYYGDGWETVRSGPAQLLSGTPGNAIKQAGRPGNGGCVPIRRACDDKESR
jgi:hypothetical protein